ncbi:MULTISPECIES: glycosyltransferase [unclassified Carboxylicivirga]|uniref:glycosyltransferase n=1 Tax=Carboxylicivirga TaxID=1628153 RepID=UPI003D34FBF4
MRVCFCNTNRSWGGGEKWHMEMAIALADKPDVQVYFLMSRRSEINKRLKKGKVQKLFLEVSKFSFLNPFRYLQLQGIFKKDDLDVIIFNGPNELKLLARPAKKCGVRKIIYRRGSDKNIKNSFLNRYLLEKVVTHIIANSEATKRSLLFTGINIANKIQVVNNGIQPPSSALKAPNACRTIIGAIGRLEKEKGFDLLIQAARVLKDRGVDFEIRIAGEGREQSRLTNLIEISGLQKYVILTGFQSDIYQFLSTCHIFALSSRYEGFGYVTVEAMFTGLPVVAFMTSAAVEIVQPEKTGILAQSYDIDEFADGLQKLIADNNYRIRLGKNGRERAYQFYSFEKSVERITNIINS